MVVPVPFGVVLPVPVVAAAVVHQHQQFSAKMCNNTEGLLTLNALNESPCPSKFIIVLMIIILTAS